MRGIRQSLIQHKVDPAAKDPRNFPVWAADFKLMRKYNLSFDIQLFHPDMGFGTALVGEQPDLGRRLRADIANASIFAQSRTSDLASRN